MPSSGVPQAPGHMLWAICYGNAVERLGACLVGRPLPPLIPPSYLQ